MSLAATRALLPGLVLAAAVWGPVCAETAASDRRLSGELAAHSDFIVRGFSRSDSGPALQAGLRFRDRGGFIAGLWGSTVEFAFDDGLRDPRQTELRAYAGYAARLGSGWSLDATVVRYEYPGAEEAVDLAYSEASLAAHFRDLLSVSVAYTPDLFELGPEATYFELTGGYPLPAGLTLSAGIGRAEHADAPVAHYHYGHIVLRRPFRRFLLQAGYYDSDDPVVPRWGEAVDGAWSIGVSFR